MKRTNKLMKDFLDNCIQYEFNNLEEDAMLIVEIFSCFGKVQNSLIVSFLTHLRNLYEFLYKENAEGRTALANHFIRDWKKKPEEFFIQGDDLQEWYKRLCAFLSHTSYLRVSGDLEYKSWPIKEFYIHFKKLLSEFLVSVDESFLTEKMIQLRERLKLI